MTARQALYERTLPVVQTYDPTPKKPLTTSEVYRALGICVSCGDAHAVPGGDDCQSCIDAERITAAAIAEAHREANESVRTARVSSLREIFGIVLRRGQP